MQSSEINALVVRIKLKGVLKAIPDSLVRNEIELYLKKKPKSEKREVFKAVRKYLHETYGAFQTRRKRKRSLYLEELKIAKEENGDRIVNSEEMKQIRRRILKTNLSTSERLEADYNTLYQGIFKEVGKVSRVMDLGSGINPVSFCPSDFRNIRVYAYDIDKNDIDFLNAYFKVMNMKGEARILDLHDLNRVRKLPEVDLCFLFKIIDPLERRGHKFSEELVKSIKSKKCVISFATKTVSRKPMNHPQRGWFEQMIKRNGFSYKTIKTKNEIYYVVSKTKN